VVYYEPVPNRLLVPAILLLAAGCTRAPQARQYELVGQVLAIRSDGREVTIRHQEIKGFMPAMTMPFQVKDPAVAKGRLPGDLVKATLLVTDDESWLSHVEKTGWAPLPDRAESKGPQAELLKPGEAVPDETLIDQDGKAFRLSSLRGSAVLLTFIYTRCPLPDFCPRMDAQFRSIQRALKAGRIQGRVHLLSVSFDPDYDTPAVLRTHAGQVGADKALWTFATGPRARVDDWGSRLGLSVIRVENDPNDITHNLCTAVIDRGGRLVTIFFGNQWTPDQAIAALASVPAS